MMGRRGSDLYFYICGYEHWGYRTKFNLRILKLSIQITANIPEHKNKLIVIWSLQPWSFYKPWIKLYQWHRINVYDEWDTWNVKRKWGE